MIMALENYLKENIDASIELKKWEEQENLPLFLLEAYSFYQLSILDVPCLLMYVTDEAPSVDTLIKHMRVIKKIYSGQLIVAVKKITAFKRKNLIEEGIPFLIENGQMYLPFLGLDLKKITNRKIDKPEQFSATAQLVYLMFLYDKEMQINATQMAKKLNVTVMTSSRALNELNALGLLEYEVNGKTERSKTYRRINDPKYYRLGNTRLKNPVRKTVYMESLPETCPIAGLEALANQTMINGPTHPVRAISKEIANQEKGRMINDQETLRDKNFFEVQIWHYNPHVLSINNQVDKLSLKLSLEKISDDRIDMAIQKILEDEPWYME